MARKLRVGIAGYGVVGRRRRQFIDEHPRLRVAAVSDVKLDPEENLGDGVRGYSDFRELIAREPLDMLFVCLPNYLAPDATILGLERGLHVFCEKPPGRDLADIERVIRCERRHRRQRLKYGFNHRYHGSVQKALSLVRGGTLGKLVNLNGVYGKSAIIPFSGGWRAERRYAGGGILLDQGIHMVDLMRLFAGEFVQIHSIVSNAYWGHDVEDNAYALMRARSGVVALLHSSATLWRHRFRLDIALEQGSLALKGILSGSKSYGDETLTVATKTKDDSGDPPEVTTHYQEDNSWRDEIFEFTEAVLKDRPITSGSSSEALKTMELIYRIYCSDSDWKKKYGLRCAPSAGKR